MSLQEMIDRNQWFHGINFGHNLQSKGRSTPQNWSLYAILSFMERIQFKNTRVLDIGTMDGLVAFSAEKGGAAEVIATDLYERNTFYLAQEILKSKVIYHPNTSIEDLLEKFGPGSFDIVIMGGLLYHLTSPLRGLLTGRFLLKTGGLLLLETVTCDVNEPDLRFNPGNPVMNEYTTLFVPTVPAVESMMCFTLQEVLGAASARASLSIPFSRSSFVAQAVSLENPSYLTDLMREMQQRASRSHSDRFLDEFSFSKLRDLPYTDVGFNSFNDVPSDIDIHTFKCNNTLQPKS
jgi:tRNA (mo5U34)-methyltransferase